jgi:hypothetical protein
MNDRKARFALFVFVYHKCHCRDHLCFDDIGRYEHKVGMDEGILYYRHAKSGQVRSSFSPRPKIKSFLKA